MFYDFIVFFLFPLHSYAPVLNEPYKPRPLHIADLSPIHRAHHAYLSSPSLPRCLTLQLLPLLLPEDCLGWLIPSAKFIRASQWPLPSPGTLSLCQAPAKPLAEPNDLQLRAQHETRTTVPIFQMWEPSLPEVHGLAQGPCISHSVGEPVHSVKITFI